MDERADVTSERSAEEIRRDIEARRESISETVDLLGDRLHRSLDWREHVGRHPFVALGAAAGLGMGLASMLIARMRARRTGSVRL